MTIVYIRVLKWIFENSKKLTCLEAAMNAPKLEAGARSGKLEYWFESSNDETDELFCRLQTLNNKFKFNIY